MTLSFRHFTIAFCPTTHKRKSIGIQSNRACSAFELNAILTRAGLREVVESSPDSRRVKSCRFLMLIRRGRMNYRTLTAYARFGDAAYTNGWRFDTLSQRSLIFYLTRSSKMKFVMWFKETRNNISKTQITSISGLLR